MPSGEKLPPRLRAALALKGGGDAACLLAVEADLLPDGCFGAAWLIVTAERLLVFDRPAADGTWLPRVDLPLADLTAARTDLLVGGGALVVTAGERVVEEVRFTNARQRAFSRAGKFLADMAAWQTARRENKIPLPAVPVVPDQTDEPRRCPTCNLILPEGTQVCPACVHKGQVLWRILGYLRPYSRQTLAVSLLMLASTLLSLVPPYLTRPLMDRVIAPVGAAPAPVERRLTWLAWLVAAMFVAQAVSQAIAIVRGRMVVWLGTHLANDLRSRLYEHLQLLSLRFFDKRPTGTLIARVTRDTESLENVIMEGAQFFLANILVLVGIGIVLFTMNWRLALLILIPVPVVALLSRWFWERIHRVWDRHWHARQQFTAVLSDSLTGIRVVRAFAQEPQEVARFAAHSHTLFLTELRAERTWTTFFPLMWFLIGIGSVIAWYVGGRQIICGQPMTLGMLTAFLAYLGMFYGPLQFLSRIADYLARSLTAAQRVFEILDQAPDVPDSADAAPLPRIEGHVEFRTVTFGYDAHKPVLQGFTLDVQPGEMIGLVGHSGAGKSTTINLLCRFYDPQEGQILIDGTDVRRIPQHDLRTQIGVVLQETFLFNGTIAENIRYAKPGATREEIMDAARTANAHDFIVQKSDGYDTVVGERGQSLSGGERQRIAIARAVLHNPRILILDEATASVDTDTERQIQEAIARLTRGRTTFAIAHRLSTLRNANRLVVLKQGKIEEVGTHDELLEKKGEFHRLVQMQQEMSRMREVVR